MKKVSVKPLCKKTSILKDIDAFISDMQTRLDQYKREHRYPCEMDFARIDMQTEEFSQVLVNYNILGETTTNNLFFRTLKTPYEWQLCEKIQSYKKKLDMLYYDYVMYSKDDSRHEMYNHTDFLLKATMEKLGW